MVNFRIRYWGSSAGQRRVSFRLLVGCQSRYINPVLRRQSCDLKLKSANHSHRFLAISAKEGPRKRILCTVQTKLRVVTPRGRNNRIHSLYLPVLTYSLPETRPRQIIHYKADIGEFILDVGKLRILIDIREPMNMWL